MLTMRKVVGRRKGLPTFIQNSMMFYINNLNVFNFPITSFHPCRLQHVYGISIRIRRTVAEYCENKSLFEEFLGCLPAFPNIGIL